MLIRTTSSLPIEARAMLDDSATLKTIKESFLNEYHEWSKNKQELQRFLSERLSKIESRKLLAFDKWFLKECLPIIHKQKIDNVSEKEKVVWNLRSAIIEVDNFYKNQVSGKRGNRLSREEIGDILSRVPIELVIGLHCELKRAGRNYRACCPFHNEKTPSFFIFPKTNTAKCFGCGWFGNAIQFLKDYRQLSFQEAIDELSNF